MSPASYLTAPPRDAASIVAKVRLRRTGPGGLAVARAESMDEREPSRQHRNPGHGVEKEMVARDDDREHDEGRVDRADPAEERRAPVEHEPGPDSDRVRGVERGHGGDRVRERRRSRRADVDAGKDEQRVLEPDPGQPRRRGREEPVDQQGDRRGRKEAVAEAAEAVARAAVEPDEEDAGDDEVAEEVEEVQRVHDVRKREERPLERLFPGKAEPFLDGLDPPRVREGLRPVRRHRQARSLVGGEGPEHDGELRDRVTSRQERCPDTRHRRYSNTLLALPQMVWLALIAALLLVVGSSVYLTLKGLEAFRAFKALGGAVRAEVDRVLSASAEIERHLALASESGTRLDRSLTRLSASRARLNVLTSALDDARAAAGRITSVYP